MKLADVLLSWTPSVSLDVVSVEVDVTKTDGTEVFNNTLLPEVSSVIVEGLEEKVNYLVTITVSDGVNTANTTLEMDIPDLSVPQAVENLSFEVVKVYDSENTEELELEDSLENEEEEEEDEEDLDIF